MTIEASLINAPGDGIAPALLITLGHRGRGQYLFHVPEGFSRLVLEHKIRPSSNLRVAFATDLQSLGGFAGLVMRLRSEGHGEIQLVGPRGTLQVVKGLRHFIRWNHPAVLISEIHPGEQPMCFEDEHVAVAALWEAPLVPELWPAPAWLLRSCPEAMRRTAQQEEDGAGLAADSPSASSSSSSACSTSSSEVSDIAGGSSNSSSSDSEDSRLSAQGAPSAVRGNASKPAATSSPAGPAAAPAPVAARTPPIPLSMFEDLDKIFTQGGAGGAGRAGRGGRGRGAGLGGRGPSRGTRLSVLERLRAGTAQADAAGGGPAAQQGGGSGEARVEVRGAAAAAAVAATARRPRAAPPPTTTPVIASAAAGAAAAAAAAAVDGGEGAGEVQGGSVCMIGGKPYRQLAPSAGISIWVHDKVSSRVAQASGRGTPAGRGAGAMRAEGGAALQTLHPRIGSFDHQGGKSLAQGRVPTPIPANPGRRAPPAVQQAQQGAAHPLLAYLLHIKATDQLLLVASLAEGGAAVRKLGDHPALHWMRQQPGRVAGCVVMAAAGLAHSPRLRRLVEGLPGQHVVLERPGPGAGHQALGHLAAARTTCKLHLVAPTVFPLPPALRARAAVLQEGGSQGDAGCVNSGGSDAAMEGPGAGVAAGAASQQAVAGAEAEVAEPSAEEVAGGGSGREVGGSCGTQGVECKEEEEGVEEKPCNKGSACSAAQHARQHERPGRHADGASRVHSVCQVSKAVWRPASGEASGLGGATAARNSPLPAAEEQRGSGVGGGGGSVSVTLSLEPAEVFTARGDAGEGAEGRAGGGDPAAVWRELRDSKDRLPALLEGLAGVTEALGKLAPLPSDMQPAPPVSHSGAQLLLPAAQQAQRQAQLGDNPRPPSKGNFPQPPQPLPFPPPHHHGAPAAGPPYPPPPASHPPPPSAAILRSTGSQYPALPCPPRPHLNPPPPAPLGMMWVLMPIPGATHPPPPTLHGQLFPAPPCSTSAVHGSLPPPPLSRQPPSAAAGAATPPFGGGSAGEESTAGAQLLGKRSGPCHGGPAAVGAVSGAGGDLESNKDAASGLRDRLLKRQRRVQPAPGGPAAWDAHKGGVAEGGQTDCAAGAVQTGGAVQATAGEVQTVHQPGQVQQAVPPLPPPSACTAPGGEQGQVVDRLLQGAPECVRSLMAGGGGDGRRSGGSAPEVVFLGTGCAEPSKYRGASAIHIRLGCGRGLLLDCGEGCLGQMERAYGHRQARRHVAALAAIWISHRHADHMLGLLSLLAARPAALPPLLVVGPYSARDWLGEVAGPLRLRYTWAHCMQVNDPGHWTRAALAAEAGLVQLHSVPVRHCSDSYGVVVGHREGWRVVYSGDTQPSESLIQAGRGCTLLIHEATFEPCMGQQAALKRHSTTAEALQVAQCMGAYRTILTHFSQRYPKFPEGLPTEGPAADSTAVAFDGMRVPLAALPLLPALRPAVEYVLASEEGEAGGGEARGVGA